RRRPSSLAWKLRRFRSTQFQQYALCDAVRPQEPTASGYHRRLQANDSRTTSLLVRRAHQPAVVGSPPIRSRKLRAPCSGLHEPALAGPPTLVVWKRNQKSGATSRRTHGDHSIVTFDYPLDDRKPQAASIPAHGKHRVEDPGHSFFLNSWTRILNLD